VRRPSPRLGEGIVTHEPRRPLDADLAQEQWLAYVGALEDAGWETVELPPAGDCPDGVFVEDILVVHGDVAVVTRPGAPSRRRETEGVEQVVAELGCRVERIREPGTLDGGDLLRRGDVAFVGVGGRTNAEGAKQLARLSGLHVVPVPVPRGFLHLKSALTFLADGTRVDGNVLPLGETCLLVASDPPAVADIVTARGYEPIVVDISELQKLEADVTCLSVLL